MLTNVQISWWDERVELFEISDDDLVSEITTFIYVVNQVNDWAQSRLIRFCFATFALLLMTLLSEVIYIVTDNSCEIFYV